MVVTGRVINRDRVVLRCRQRKEKERRKPDNVHIYLFFARDLVVRVAEVNEQGDRVRSQCAGEERARDRASQVQTLTE